MLTIFFICPAHSAEVGAERARLIVETAFPDMGEQNIMLAGAASLDATHGMASAAVFSKLNDVNLVMTFGKASKSFGDEMEHLTAKSVVLPSHGKSTPIVSLPAATSSYWEAPDNVVSAVAAVKDAMTIPSTGAEFIWSENHWN